MKELKYLLEVILSLAVWVKVLLYLLLSAVVVSIAGYFGWRNALVAGLIMLALGLGLVFLAYLGEWVRKRKAAELRGDLDDSGKGRRTVDPGVARRLEALRSAFDAGIQKFQVFGKGLDELPWFLLVGEPGAGKSSAIRHSGVELPQNLHDKDQGLQGTANLNWWFTNYAVVLEAGGSVLFSSSQSPATPDWDELSNLLNDQRKHCPINGLILAIPASSLLSDSQVEVERKAGTVARHLDILRKRIGLKFPVFVIVTKCDGIQGFSEFFASMSDEARHQIFGWSNPAALDAPVRTELIEAHFQTVAQRLRRQRLEILLDPVPSTGSHRKADEVDELFGLPANLPKILPNLLRYVENIFVPGEWSLRPLFLRGIYLTAASGVESRVIAAAVPSPLGVSTPIPVGSPGAIGSIFLRDVFLNKVFREDSLVTNSGTGARERHFRRLLLFMLGILGLVGLFLNSILSYSSMLKKQNAQIEIWNRATDDWDNNIWFPIVKPVKDAPNEFVFAGDLPVGSGLDLPQGMPSQLKNVSLVDYHQLLAGSASKPLAIPLVFHFPSWLVPNIDHRRFFSQRVVFEGGVVKPLLDATRLKMSAPPHGLTTGSSSPTDLSKIEGVLAAEAKALSELVRIEAAIIDRSLNKPTTPPGATFIPSLLEYVADHQKDDRLVNLMNWTYLSNPTGSRQWAPKWMSGGGDLNKNKAIQAGVERLVSYSQLRVDNLSKNLSDLQSLADVVTKYAAAELALSQAASIRDQLSVSEPAVANALVNLENVKVELDEKINTIRQLGLFEDGPETLSSALSNLSSNKDSHLGQVEVILKIIEDTLPAPPVASPTPSKGSVAIALPPPDINSTQYRLLLQIKKELSGISNLIQQKLQNTVTPQLVQNYAGLDAQVLSPFQGIPVYLWRWNLYQASVSSAPDFQFNSSMYLVGENWTQLGSLLLALDQIQQRSATYTGTNPAEFTTICNYFLQRTRTLQTNLFVSNYILQSKAAILRVARFPVVWPPGSNEEALSVNQVVGVKALLDSLQEDAAEPVFRNLSPAISQPVTAFLAQLSPLTSIVDALIHPDGSARSVTVTLYGASSQAQLSGPNFTPMPVPTPTPTPPPKSLMSKMFFGIGAPPPQAPPPGDTINIDVWNAVSLEGTGPAAVYPLSDNRDTPMGVFPLDQAFGFRVYHSLLSEDGSDIVSGGGNWSSLRLIAQLGGKPVGVGTDWQVPLKPNQPTGVWIKLTFETPLPPMPWPTTRTLGLLP